MKIGKVSIVFSEEDLRIYVFALFFTLMFIVCCMFLFEFVLIPSTEARKLLRKLEEVEVLTLQASQRSNFLYDIVVPPGEYKKFKEPSKKFRKGVAK